MRRTALAIVFVLVMSMTSMTVVTQSRRAERVEKAKDPVCGLMVNKDPTLSTTYKGETYYFCSQTDLNEFKKAPEKFVKKGF